MKRIGSKSDRKLIIYKESTFIMKKIIALAAAAALTAGVSAFAANPFSDVSTDDWAYQAVSDLSDQGVVEGYPDGTFKGERNITRFELAQVIARLMAKEDQLNAEQKATLDKLAGEYADELGSLGVRVSNLEKKVGNISWFGDARFRYTQKYGEKGKAVDTWRGRMRINAKAQVNDSTYVRGRFATNMYFKDAKKDDGDTKMNVLYAHHNFNDKFSMNVGRSFLTLGQTAFYYDDFFDGVQAFYGDKTATLELGYGRMHTWNAGDYVLKTTNADWGTSANDDPETWYARVYGGADKFKYDVEYIDTKAKALGADKQQIWGAGITAGLGNSGFDVFGDFYQNTKVDGDPHMWTAGIGYGHMNAKKPGTWRLSAQYVDAETGAYFGGNTSMVDPMSIPMSNDKVKGVNEVKYWQINGDLSLQKNVYLHGEYALNVKTDGTSSTDYDDLAAVSINYVF